MGVRGLLARVRRSKACKDDADATDAFPAGAVVFVDVYGCFYDLIKEAWCAEGTAEDRAAVLWKSLAKSRADFEKENVRITVS